MTELIYLAALAAGSYSVGSFILNKVGMKFSSFGEEALFAQALGLILFAYATLILGLLGLLQGVYLKIAVIFVLVLSYKRLKRLLVHLWKLVGRKRNYRLRFYNILALTLVVFVILNMLAAHAPVYSSDAVSYHIAAPKLYAGQHAITHIPYMITSSYPMITEMLFLDGFLLKGGKLSKLIAAYLALLSAVAIFLFARKYFGPMTGLLAATIFYTLPIVSVFNVRGFVDISTAFFGIIALFALFNWHQTNDSKMLFFGGVLAGAAAATKLSAYPIAAVLYLVVAYVTVTLKKDMLKEFGRNSIIYLVGVAVVMLPWLVRAFVYTGNPFYPLFSNILGGVYLSADLASFWVQSLAIIGFGTSFIDLVVLPWNLTMHSIAFGEQLGIGPMFLAFVPLLIFIRKVDRKVLVLLGLTVPMILIWFYTAQSPRYIFLVYALLSIVCAYVIGRLTSNSYRIAVLAVVMFTIAINFGFWAGANNDELKVVSGLTDEDEFLRSKMTNYELLQYANNNIQNATICLYGEIRGYYGENDYVWCHPLFQGYVDFYTIDSSDELLARMNAVGITHLLVESQIDTFKHYDAVAISSPAIAKANKLIGEVVSKKTVKLFENEHGAIYEVTYS